LKEAGPRRCEGSHRTRFEGEASKSGAISFEALRVEDAHASVQ
jgi:hypothetical protein